MSQLSHCAWHAAHATGLAIILALSTPATLAQDRPPARDPIMLSVTEAQNEGRLLDAEKTLRNAIADTEQSEPNNPRLGNYLRRLAMIVGDAGHPSEQMALNRRALDVDRAAFGPGGLRVADDLDVIALLTLNQGNQEEAEQLSEQALEIAQLNKANLKSSYFVDAVGSVLGQVGNFYLREHRWSEAEPIILEMKQVCGLLGQHPGIVLGCDGYPALLAELYRGEGRTAEAERQRPVPMGLPAELANLNNTAEQYEKGGLYVEAEVTYRQAIAWVESNRILPTGIGLGTDMLVEQYNRLGGALEKQGRTEQAEATYKGSIELQEAVDPKEPLDVSYFDCRPLLSFYRAQGRVSDIEPIITNALRIQEGRLGTESVHLIQTLVSLADVYQEEGEKKEAKYAAAQPLYERALKLQQTAVGPAHPQLLLVLGPYYSLLRKMHQDVKAADVHSRIDKINQARQKDRN